MRTRIEAQPAYPNAVTVAEAARLIRRAAQTPHHTFLPCDLSLLDAKHVAVGQLLGHRQVTDAYLLALAVQHGARFVTFDTSVPVDMIPGASAEDCVILNGGD